MELDEMKLAWQTLDRQLERQHALNLQLFRDGRLDKLRRGLRPLVWGQAVQMLIGVGGMLLFAPFWIAHRHEPAMLVAGLVMHLYCIGLVVFGGIMQGQIAGIDHSAPVVEIQRRLLRLRRTYAVGGALIVGLPWWFLYVPLLMVLAKAGSGVNLLDSAPSFVYIGLAIGFAGLLATWWFHQWSHRPERAGLGRKLDDSAAGGSIRRAQATLDEIARFERE
ncbi:MAG: serine/threonine protein kinase [Rhodanobacteraceae bacterium]